MMPSFKSLVPSINYVPSRVSGYALITNSDAAGQDLTIGKVQNSNHQYYLDVSRMFKSVSSLFFIAFSTGFHTHGP